MNPMPKEISEAVCAVMANMKKLPKSEKNQHGGYNFASIDAFLSAMNPLCADAGLFIVQDEESVDTIQVQGKNGPQTWLNMRFSFTLAHRSGSVWGPVYRTVMVQATGAQAFGSGQSYAQKQFMRSLFQIATGEKDDPDFSRAEDLPNTTPKPAKRGAEPRPEAKKCFLLTDPVAGEVKEFERAGDWLTEFDVLFTESQDQGAVWDANMETFTTLQAATVKNPTAEKRFADVIDRINKALNPAPERMAG